MLWLLRKLPIQPAASERRYASLFVPSLSEISQNLLFFNDGKRYRTTRTFHTRRNGYVDGTYHKCHIGSIWSRRNGIVFSSLSSKDNRRFLSSLIRKNSKAEDFFHDEFDYNNDDDDDDDDDEQKSTSYQPWKTLLEAPARAAWRASDPRRDPPEYLRNAVDLILNEGHRTSKQLKRAHRKVLSIQSELAELRERERRIIVNGKRHFKQQQQQQQQQDHFDDNGFDTGDDNSIGALGGKNYRNNASSSTLSAPVNPVCYGYDETLATLKHRLEPNFSITKRVLSECQSLLGGKLVSVANGEGELEYSNHWQPKRILDFGIGCGSASAAAIDLFGSVDNNNNSQSHSSAIEWVHGIDPSRTMRECSEKLIEEMTRGHHQGVTSTVSDDDSSPIPPPPPRVTFSNSLTPSSDDSSSATEGSFDLALFVYTASDLPDVSSCLAAAAMAFEKLKPNGVFVMIEPGTPDGFNSTRAVRNMLLDCCPPHDPEFEWEERCHIIAPCTHNGSCPMERHKKNFFKHKKPIGKLGHDLPQQLQDESLEVSSDSDGDDYDAADNEEIAIEDFDQDDVELDVLDSSLKMTATDAFNSSFCSFVHSMPGDSRKKGEKFSYLVAQKQRFRPPNFDAHCNPIDPSTEGDPFRDDNVTTLLADALDAASLEADDLAYRTFESARDLSSRYTDSENDDLGLELLQGEDKRQSMGRIIRAPIKKKGHVYIDYCAGPGRIIRSRVTKALSNSVAPGIYSAARKSRWGGLWPDTMDRLISAQFSNDKNNSKG